MEYRAQKATITLSKEEAKKLALDFLKTQTNNIVYCVNAYQFSDGWMFQTSNKDVDEPLVSGNIVVYNNGSVEAMSGAEAMMLLQRKL